MKLFLDLETIPTQDPAQIQAIADEIRPPGNFKVADTIAKWEAETKPGLVEAAVAKTSMDGAYGRVAVIGYAFDDEDPQSLFDPDWASPASEPDLMRAFFSVLENRIINDSSAKGGGLGLLEVIGHNVAAFDLRFLWQRCMIHGIRPPAQLPRNPKPWDPHVHDTMIAWTGDARSYVKLDKLCSIFGIAGKGSEIGGEDIDGSKVWEFVRSGRIAEVAAYCAGDVERAREVYRRQMFVGVDK